MFRRSMLLSSLIGAASVAGAVPAGAGIPQYPPLARPAIKVRDPTQIYFVAGAVAGTRILAGGQLGVIIYSDDSGKSWAQAEVPVSATVTSLAFASPRVGWATGSLGVILKTEDGGKTWVKQLDGLAEIALMNTELQAFLATQPAGSPDAEHAKRRAGILTVQGPDKPFLSLLPVSEAEVFAFGTYRSAEHTTDGGKSWTDWSMHINDPQSHNIYAATAIGTTYYLVSEAGLIFRSTDGGQSFPILAQPGDATFFGICDTGAGGILAYGVAGEMYLSTDQGKTWNAPQFTGASNVNSVIRLPGGELIAGDSGGGLWISKDHGTSFALATRNPIMAVNALLPLGGSQMLILSGTGLYPFDLSQLQG